MTSRVLMSRKTGELFEAKRVYFGDKPYRRVEVDSRLYLILIDLEGFDGWIVNSRGAAFWEFRDVWCFVIREHGEKMFEDIGEL